MISNFAVTSLRMYEGSAILGAIQHSKYVPQIQEEKKRTYTICVSKSTLAPPATMTSFIFGGCFPLQLLFLPLSCRGSKSSVRSITRVITGRKGGQKQTKTHTTTITTKTRNYLSDIEFKLYSEYFS